MYCLCGCGQLVNPGRKYILNHSHIGKHHTEESKKKTSESEMGKVLSEETKQKMSIVKTGFVVKEETKQKISKSLKGRFAGENSPNWQGGYYTRN